ncbi:MAG TPA: hypothetical protein VGD31_02515 [Sphingobacteriaceae bacterium]
MKRKLVIITGLLLASVLSFSQSRLTEDEKKEFKQKQEAYQSSLNLNEDQASKMEEINLAYFEGLKSLKSSNESKLSKYKKLKSLNTERDSKARALLNDEQYKIYKEHQKEMKEEFREKRGSR